MTVVDTSVLIASLTSDRPAFSQFQDAFLRGERLLLPSIVLFEWLRGPRTPLELAHQDALLPSDAAIPFGVREAGIAARLYRQVSRARGREMDLAIAAYAIAREIPLWTLNRKDFADIPGLQLAP